MSRGDGPGGPGQQDNGDALCHSVLASESEREPWGAKGAFGLLLALCVADVAPDVAPEGQPFALGLARLGTRQQATGS